MALRIYVYIWLLFLAFFCWEYTALNGLMPLPSLIQTAELHGWVHFKAVPDPGRSLSLYLGWSGLVLMIVMNVYSLRRRTDFMNGMGKLSSWLNFHVFCGLLGPTLILFHCNFKVRGVVAISFWSMVVSFTSGVVGRYFYLQIVMKKVDLQSESQIWQGKLQRYLKNCKIQWSEEEFGPYLVGARTMAGMAATEVGLNPFVAFYKSVLGDWRLRTRNLPMPEKWPAKTQVALRQYALNMRKASTVSSFQRLMGYWHAFHFPFAIFMYVAAAIHVASSLVLGV
jgi:hypothetical protein